jgi:hypothetical protein
MRLSSLLCYTTLTSLALGSVAFANPFELILAKTLKAAEKVATKAAEGEGQGLKVMLRTEGGLVDPQALAQASADHAQKIAKRVEILNSKAVQGKAMSAAERATENANLFHSSMAKVDQIENDLRAATERFAPFNEAHFAQQRLLYVSSLKLRIELINSEVTRLVLHNKISLDEGLSILDRLEAVIEEPRTAYFSTKIERPRMGFASEKTSPISQETFGHAPLITRTEIAAIKANRPDLKLYMTIEGRKEAIAIAEKELDQIRKQMNQIGRIIDEQIKAAKPAVAESDATTVKIPEIEHNGPNGFGDGGVGGLPLQ